MCCIPYVRLCCLLLQRKKTYNIFGDFPCCIIFIVSISEYLAHEFHIYCGIFWAAERIPFFVTYCKSKLINLISIICTSPSYLFFFFLHSRMLLSHTQERQATFFFAHDKDNGGVCARCPFVHRINYDEFHKNPKLCQIFAAFVIIFFCCRLLHAIIKMHANDMGCISNCFRIELSVGVQQCTRVSSRNSLYAFNHFQLDFIVLVFC